ncbi:MAG TPA: hypothetical protein VFW25_02555 [Silvibacterium sp.]|nr:hypothetical protein [Silvibacterium sp.]
MGRILKSYFFWTYERGSFHYDVMVTLILAFLFVTPFLWNYGDRPQPDKLGANSMLVKLAGPGNYIFDVPAREVNGTGGGPLDVQLEQKIQAVSGPVTLDRFEAVKEPGGKIVTYRVWAHR